MSLFNRIGLLLRSNINSMVSKAEDPEKILNQLLIDMREQFITAKKQVAVAIADEKRLYAKYTESKKTAADWEKKAMLALQKGDEGLAREALARKTESDGLAEQWQSQWVAQKQATEQLRQALNQLNQKIGEAKRKKDLLIARAKRAEAQKTIQSTMGGLNDNSAFDAFERMTEKVEQTEAEAEAAGDLAAELSGQNLEDKFKALEHDSGTDDALAALKAKMGLAPAAASVNAPAALDYEDEFPVPDIGVTEGEKTSA
ncbi:MAG: PspA/IM30 family protein [Deltaproteobacteria bacterium]|nr:PspA/IM30 family protein [Deltaproteobacteria bacterium]